MTASPADPNSSTRPRPTFGLASLVLAMVAIGAEIVALKNAAAWTEAWGEPWGEGPAAAVCLLAGAAIGMIELRRARGFGTLRGRLFQGAFGGLAGGAVFAILTITLETFARNAQGQPHPPWSDLAMRLGMWLLWGGLAGGVLGAVVDLCLAPRRRPLPPRNERRAAEFLATLPEKDKPDAGS